MRSLAVRGRCLERDGRPWTIAAYGNVVTAFDAGISSEPRLYPRTPVNPVTRRHMERHVGPNASDGAITAAAAAHDWRQDVAFLVETGGDYARLWHMLAGDTQQWPWLKLPSGKWDLEQWNPTYWAEKREVMRETRAKGIVLEVHVFDRGMGGSNNDYRAYPWHPANNVQDLGRWLPEAGDGLPEFYEAPGGSDLSQLQLALAKKWAEEALTACDGRCPHVILEVDNEYRGFGIGWPKRIAAAIKAADPQRVVSHSSLGEDLEAAYTERDVDVVCKHYGNDGNDPRVLYDYVARHWEKGKPVNIDEFANGQRDPAAMRAQVRAIVDAGGHFHIEDAEASAKPEVAAAEMRALIAQTDPPRCEAGPTNPPTCPKETKRGHSILYVNRGPSRVCTGNTACLKAMGKGELRPNDNFVFDATALAGTQEPIPPGCGTCDEDHTRWTSSMGGRSKADPDGCGFEVWPAHSGSVESCDSQGKKCVSKPYKVQ